MVGEQPGQYAADFNVKSSAIFMCAGVLMVVNDNTLCISAGL